MANAADRELKILLTLAANVSAGKTQAVGALKEVEAQAISTAKATGEAINIGALSPQGRADLAQTLATGKGIGIFANEAKVAAGGMAANFGIAGVNLARAKQEAIVLMREIAAGNIRASTLSSLMGSMGNSIAIAGVAAYGLGVLIQRTAEEQLRLNKELEKSTEHLSDQVDKWIQQAKVASDFGDVVKLGLEMGPALHKAAADLVEFRAQQVSGFGVFFDYVMAGFALMHPGSGDLITLDATQLAAAKKAQEELFRQRVVDAIAIKNLSKESADYFEKIKSGPTLEGILNLTAKIESLRARSAALDQPQVLKPDATFDDVRRAGKAYEEQAQLDAELKVSLDLRKKLGAELDKENEAATKATEREQRQQINASLREQETLLEKIRQQQQLINANPFLSADQKQKLSFLSMTAELAELSHAIEKTKQDITGSALDPALHERLQRQLQKDNFAFDQLKIKIKSTTFGGQIGAELIQWVNSLGTTAHQVASIITNVLGAAIDGISQGISGLIVGTQTWEQAWNSAVSSVIAGIVRVVVQYIASQIAMFVIRQIFGQQESGLASKAAGAAAAKWAPAAISASIASEGAAAGYGTAAYLAALAVGEAAAVAASSASGFKRGGYTGDGSVDEYAGPAHKKEFVFDASATRSHGIENLELARRGQASIIPHFGTGGRIYENTPRYTFGPRGFRGDFDAPTADTDFYNRNLITHFRGGQYFPDAGQYGGPATLPTDPGGIEPPILIGPDQDAPTHFSSDGPIVEVPRLTFTPVFDDPPGQPTVKVTNWNLTGSAPYWHQPSSGYLPAQSYYHLPGTPPWDYGADPSSPGWVRVPGAPGVFEQSAFTNDWTWNSSRGLYERFESGSLLTSSGFIDPATGLTMPPPSSGSVSSPSSPGGETVGGAGITSPRGPRGFGISWGGGIYNTPMDATTSAFLLAGGYGGNPNFTGSTSDAGHDIFPLSGKYLGQIDAEGGISRVLNPSLIPGMLPYRMPSQAEAWALDLTHADPASAKRNNDWIVAHNQDIYAHNAAVLAAWKAKQGNSSWGPWGNPSAEVIPHGADGLRIPGPPSRSDTIPAWLSTGEEVVPADTTALLDRKFGRDWAHNLANMRFDIERPHFASGGRANSSSSAPSSAAVSGGDVHVYIFDDFRKAQKAFHESPEGRKIFKTYQRRNKI
jgi:hypothetical protein